MGMISSKRMGKKEKRKTGQVKKKLGECSLQLDQNRCSWKRTCLMVLYYETRMKKMVGNRNQKHFHRKTRQSI